MCKLLVKCAAMEYIGDIGFTNTGLFSYTITHGLTDDFVTLCAEVYVRKIVKGLRVLVDREIN